MKNIFRIIKISKPLHHIVAALSILILLTSLLALIAPILSKFIVDEIVQRVQHGQGSVERLIFLIVIAFAANLLSLFVTTVGERLGDHFAGRLTKFLTEKFYDKVLRLSTSYFASEISGKIVNQLSRGIATIQDFINTGTNFILPTFLQSIFTIAVLAYYSMPIAIFTFILFPIYLTLSYYSSIKWGKEEVKKNKIEDFSRGRIQEVLSNMGLVKSFNNEKNEYKIISKNLDQSNEIYANQSRTYHLFDFFRGLSLNIILFLINIFVFYDTFRGAISIGEMVLIIQLVNQARIPLFAMSFILTRVQAAEAGSKEYFEVLNLESNEDYTKDVDLRRIENPSISFENVEFNYENSKSSVLRRVSFKIGKNETVALVGHSGAGKTTIVNLILKFYIPTRGKIFLKGKNYEDLDHTYIRNNISLVFQDNELFSSTIRENVSYGRNAKDREIINALRLANAYDFVAELSKGLDSQIGERGIKLSGGQKQRLQIARAILKNAPILILDEATSSLDAKSENEVQEGLKNLIKDKLVIIIAHRFSTLRNVDRVLVLDKGRIAEEGRPQELAKKPGIYSDLLHYQIEGNKKLLESFEIY